MLQTIEAVLNPNGKIDLFEAVKVTSPQKVLVTILKEPRALKTTKVNFKTALLAMPYVGEDSDFQREQDHGRNIEILIGH
ncbi:hypothetical protein BGP_4527 [Beggiatoa sp. PS]|nr:hypothetical protein BGP_4527 [Beggiatoa sp. PS]